jgi:hypothetical protein
MAFTVPDFPLTCNIWTGPAFPAGAPRLTSPCNLAFGKRVTISPEDVTTNVALLAASQLLLPKLTDIRDASCNVVNGADIVECPAGSGRYYFSEYVEDLGKGFANEHRIAMLIKACAANSTAFVGHNWPTPIP